MSEETQAASSTAVADAPMEIPRSGTPEYAQWRVDGSLPEKVQPNKEESATSDASKETNSEDSADSAATMQEKQGKRRPDIEARFKQYTERIDKLERELNEARNTKETKAESSPAKPAPSTSYKEWRKKEFNSSKWLEEYQKQNPEANYEDANVDMADYLSDVKEHFRTIERDRQLQSESLQAKVEEGRKRYGKTFDEVVEPTAKKVKSSVSSDVEQMLNESNVLADLLFTLGSDADELQRFLKMSPSEAKRHIAKLESGIVEELSKGDIRNDKGQFSRAETPITPAKRGPESAPEPPIEIGSRGAGQMNESDRAFQAIARGDAKATRAWLDAENRKALSKRRGV